MLTKWENTFREIYGDQSGEFVDVGALLPNSLYRAARFANFEGIWGFSVPSIIWVGAGLMQITLFEHARKNKTENGEGNRDGECNFC